MPSFRFVRPPTSDAYPQEYCCWVFRYAFHGGSFTPFCEAQLPHDISRSLFSVNETAVQV